jgi:Helix-turn-helix
LQLCNVLQHLSEGPALLVSYYAQLEQAARFKGLSLEAACIAAGLPDSTPWRWRKGLSAGPTWQVAEKVMAQINAASSVWPGQELGDWDKLIAALAARRKELGLSQLELDLRLNVASGHVAKWECGDRRPTAFNLFCWGDALGVKLGLLGRPAQ